MNSLEDIRILDFPENPEIQIRLHIQQSILPIVERY